MLCPLRPFLTETAAKSVRHPLLKDTNGRRMYRTFNGINDDRNIANRYMKYIYNYIEYSERSTMKLLIWYKTKRSRKKQKKTKA